MVHKVLASWPTFIDAVVRTTCLVLVWLRALEHHVLGGAVYSTSIVNDGNELAEVFERRLGAVAEFDDRFIVGGVASHCTGESRKDQDEDHRDDHESHCQF